MEARTFKRTHFMAGLLSQHGGWLNAYISGLPTTSYYSAVVHGRRSLDYARRRPGRQSEL